jgi:hypothetical protein
MDKHLMPHDVVTEFYESLKPILFRIPNTNFGEHPTGEIRGNPLLGNLVNWLLSRSALH